MSNDKLGLAVLNDCKYGYGIKDGVLSLTVLKSGSYPYEDASIEVPAFTYSLYPHKYNYQKSKVIEEAYAVNRPLLYIHIDKNSLIKPTLESQKSFFELEGDGVYLETIKKAEEGEGFVCRLYEGHGKSNEAYLKPSFDFKAAYLCNLLEKEIKRLEVVDGRIKISLGKFEIGTIKII